MLYKKKKLILFGIVILFALSTTGLFAGVLGNRKIKTVSEKRIVGIEKIVVNEFEQNYKTEDYDAIKEAIIGEVNVKFPVTPGSKVKKLNFKKIEKECQDKATGKYPLTEKQLDDKYTKEANEKFVPAIINQNVDVKYKVGYEKLIKVSGVYRGFNKYHNGVKIGRKVVPIFDLLPEDKVKFIPKYRKETKRNYIDDSVKKYLQRKEKYSVTLIKEAVEQVRKDNEKAGYISAWREWREPDDIADMIYKYYLVRYMKRIKNENAKKGNTGSNTKTSTDNSKSGGDSNFNKSIKRKQQALKDELNN